MEHGKGYLVGSMLGANRVCGNTSWHSCNNGLMLLASLTESYTLSMAVSFGRINMQPERWVAIAKPRP